MEQIFGGLISYESKEQLENFIGNLDKENALKVIEMSLLYCQKNGIFSFEESHYIFKSLQKLKENENKESDLHNDDSHGDSN